MTAPARPLGWDLLLAETRALLVDAAAKGLTLRVFGSAGVRMHCPPSDDTLSQQRRSPKDIDLVCRREDRRHLRELFAARGYEVDRDLLVAMEGRRYLFRNPSSGIDVDVWVDDLEFCHTLEVRDRLLLDDPTLSLEDMLLSKLQIVDLTANDRLDIRCILDTHEVVPGSVKREEIDATHIARVLGGDWGFWRTATANLTATGSDEATSPRAAARIALLLESIEEQPKTLRWRVRARMGERVQWWQDVDLPRDTY